MADQQLPIPYAHYHRVEKSHGRIETREYWALGELKTLDKKNWVDVASIIMVKATREIRGTTQIEKRFYLSSLPASDMMSIAKAIRAHWQVESAPQAHKKEVYVEYDLDPIFRRES